PPDRPRSPVANRALRIPARDPPHAPPPPPRQFPGRLIAVIHVERDSVRMCRAPLLVLSSSGLTFTTLELPFTAGKPAVAPGRATNVRLPYRLTSTLTLA